MIKVNPNNIFKNMYRKKVKGNVIVKFIIFVLVIAILLMFTIFIMKNFFYPLKYFEIVKIKAAKNNIDPYLVMAIIKTESNFNKFATSNKDAKGLMQLMDLTAEEMKNKIDTKIDINNIYDEDVNITLGCKYLSTLINKYNGNYYLAICAYNAGMGNVDKWLEQKFIPNDLNEYKDVNIPFIQTKDYLYKVVNSYKIYRFFYE